MRIPVVLSTVDVRVDTEGQLTVTVDDQPFADDRVLGRKDLESVVAEITTDLQTAVRVTIHESDGTTYDDYATPPDTAAPAAKEPERPTLTPALACTGFRPGEEVALAYVVARQLADEDGTAAINLPPALLSAARSGLVLLGLNSMTVAPIEASL